ADTERQEKAPWSEKRSKVSDDLHRYAWPTPNQRLSGRSEVEPYAPWRDNGRLYLELKLGETAGPILAAVTGCGVEVQVADQALGVVEGWISESALVELADLPVVRLIRPGYPGALDTGSVTSEGDRAARADLVRGIGYDGSGVVVGVISDGIDDLAA